MSDTHNELVEQMEKYLNENEKFEERNVKAAAARARKALMAMSRLARTRRVEIQERKSKL